MYVTTNDGYLIRQRNAEILREVSATRLEGQLRANKGFSTALGYGLRPGREPGAGNRR